MLRININRALKGVISVLLELSGHLEGARDLVKNMPKTDDEFREWLENVSNILTDNRVKLYLGEQSNTKITKVLELISALKRSPREYIQTDQIPGKGAYSWFDLPFGANGQGPIQFSDFDGFRDRAARYLAGC